MKENIYVWGYVLGRCLNSALNVKSDFVSLPDGRGIERAAETPSPPILPRRLPPHLVRTPNGEVVVWLSPRRNVSSSTEAKPSLQSDVIQAQMSSVPQP